MFLLFLIYFLFGLFSLHSIFLLSCVLNEIKFDMKILALIAEKITTNVRELEASLNNLATYLTISGQEPSLDNIILYIKNYII